MVKAPGVFLAALGGQGEEGLAGRRRSGTKFETSMRLETVQRSESWLGSAGTPHRVSFWSIGGRVSLTSGTWVVIAYPLAGSSEARMWTGLPLTIAARSESDAVGVGNVEDGNGKMLERDGADPGGGREVEAADLAGGGAVAEGEVGLRALAERGRGRRGSRVECRR